MKKGHHKTGNAGAHVWTTIPGFQGWPNAQAPASDDPRENLASQWKLTGTITRIPCDAKGEIITANRSRALVKWLLPVPLYGWIDREYLTTEPPQAEMQIDGGFALVGEKLPEPEPEQAKAPQGAQLSLF